MQPRITMATCCWTDHSNGCPNDDIVGQEFSSTLDWLRAYHTAKVRRGYEVQKTDSELEKSARQIDAWEREWRETAKCS